MILDGDCTAGKRGAETNKDGGDSGDGGEWVNGN